MPIDIKAVHHGQCTLAGDPVSGIEKLCQKFVLELLTETGSMAFLPKRGCQFLTRLRQHARTEFDVIVAFSGAYHKVRRALRAEENRRIPKDERLASAYLTRIIIQPGGVLLLELAVRNMVGVVATVLTPPIQL